MKFSQTLSPLLMDNGDLTEEQKADKVQELSGSEQFDLLQNIEAYPSKYSREVQSALVSAMNKRNIFLF
ncbi:hypothetical protein AAGS61_05835 [Lysinibacillus sp. KU-BSD001]|uniref:hypothetical protein n=1 Tax=Lysinibacillus sp. KU-BSD001 TaxID=3141328 RepID=UPI0036E21702